MKSNVLIISDSIYKNRDIGKYSYNLTKLLVENDYNVYYIICTARVQDLDEQYSLISCDDLEMFHKDLEFCDKDDYNKYFSKVKYIVSGNKNEFFDNNITEDIVKKYEIKLVIYIASFVISINVGKLSVPIIMNYKLDYIPISDKYKQIINNVTAFVSNSQIGDQLYQKLDKTHLNIKIPINFYELDKCLIDIFWKRSRIRKLFNIEDDTIVFFIDIDAENFYEVENRCFDLMISLFHNYLNNVNSNAILIINTKDIECIRTILNYEKIPKEKCRVYLDYYTNNTCIKVRNIIYEFMIASDIFLALYGNAEYHTNIIEAQYLGLAVFLNNFSSAEEILYNGMINYETQDVYLATEVQSYIKVPKIDDCLIILTEFIKREKYKTTSKQKRKIRRQIKRDYENKFNEQWISLLDGF